MRNNSFLEIDERTFLWMYFLFGESSVSLMAMGEMVGFPSPLTGRLPKQNYLDCLKEHFLNLGIPCNAYNFQSLFFQKSHFIQHMLEVNPTLEALKVLLACSVDVTKERNWLAKIGVRNTVKELYTLEENDRNIHLQDLFNVPNFFFFRASMSQDLMFACQENLYSVFSKKHCEKVIALLKDSKLITTLTDHIKRNYETILSYQPQALIFEMGATLPQSYLFSYQKELEKYFEIYIEAVRRGAERYGVSYIEGSTIESYFQKGHSALTRQIFQTIYSQTTKKTSHVTNSSRPSFSLEEARWLEHNDVLPWFLCPENDPFYEKDQKKILWEQEQTDRCFENAIKILKR